MALDSRYITSIAFQQFLVDQITGLPLAGGRIEFYEDNNRLQFKNVYQLSGSPPNYTYTALPNPLYLSDVGTTINNSGDYVPVYFLPYDELGNVQNYYIRIFNSAGVAQYNLQAWPGLTEKESVNNLNNSLENQLSNSQFSQVNFVPSEGMTITFDGAISSKAYDIAPDWQLIISSNGAGSVTVGQVSLEGSLQIQTNPPNVLTVFTTGASVSNLILRQTLSNNPSIWSSTIDQDGYLSGCMLITSLDGQNHTIQMQYTQSGGPSNPQSIVAGNTLTNGYQFINATVLLDQGTNTDDSTDGAVYIDIVLPNIGYCGITSVQVVGLTENILVDYEQETVNRQIDHLFHYYKPQIDFKPIKSYLCGWDFPLNPAQPRGDSVTLGAVDSDYVWDQTIIYQSVQSSVIASRATSGKEVGSLKLDISTDTQLAVIQYLTVPQIHDLLTNKLSSNLVMSSTQGFLSGCISLWYTTETSVPDINTDHDSLVSVLNSDGKPIGFNGIWTEVPRSSLGDALFTLNNLVDLSDLQSVGFNGWELDPDVNVSTITYFAIVVGFSEISGTKSIAIQSCSLVPGSIPTIPAPQTATEVLNNCRDYFWMTYDTGTIPGTATINGVETFLVHSIWLESDQIGRAYPSAFTIDFGNKVTLPEIITFYSYLNANVPNSFVAELEGGPVTQLTFSSFYIQQALSKNRVSYKQVTNTNLVSLNPGITFAATGYQSFHVTIDSRIGIFTP